MWFYKKIWCYRKGPRRNRPKRYSNKLLFSFNFSQISCYFFTFFTLVQLHQYVFKDIICFQVRIILGTPLFAYTPPCYVNKDTSVYIFNEFDDLEGGDENCTFEGKCYHSFRYFCPKHKCPPPQFGYLWINLFNKPLFMSNKAWKLKNFLEKSLSCLNDMF